jgi:hypothetical protein
MAPLVRPAIAARLSFCRYKGKLWRSYSSHLFQVHRRYSDRKIIVIGTGKGPFPPACRPGGAHPPKRGRRTELQERNMRKIIIAGAALLIGIGAASAQTVNDGISFPSLDYGTNASDRPTLWKNDRRQQGIDYSGTAAIEGRAATVDGQNQIRRENSPWNRFGDGIDVIGPQNR